MMPKHELPARYARTTLLCATIIIILASLTLIGWASGLSLLASIRSNYIPMAPSTALCFLCTSVGLLEPRFGKIRVGGSRVVDMLSGEQLPRIC
jgi:hypothetical protein